MEVVITYVDGLDPLWQADYAANVGPISVKKRFRDWGTLKYLLRGIQKNMPYVDNVYLVVSRDSQVPAWVNREQLHIVRHEDIIPAEYLPTFNSTTIEMFLHRIPGLGEEYIYFNDDCFPVAPVPQETFFRQGKAVTTMRVIEKTRGMYRMHSRNAFELAVKASGRQDEVCQLTAQGHFFRPQHASSSMLRSLCEQAFSSVSADVYARLSPVRRDFNVNQYFFSDYMYLMGATAEGRIPCRHFSLARYGARTIEKFVSNPSCPLMCINDVSMPYLYFSYLRKRITAALDAVLPEKSRFEL